MITIIQDLIMRGRKNRPGKANPCQYITIHNTGNSSRGANAKSHANYIKGDAAANAQVSWHYTVDENNVYQHIPDNETAYHAGDGSGPGNAKSIGIEICMNEDGGLLKATDNAAELAATLCKKHNIDVKNVVQHNRWTGKNCPQMLRQGKPYNWDVFIAKIKEAASDKQKAESIPVLGSASVDAMQAEKWARQMGATESFAKLSGIYWRLAPMHGGVNPSVAFCQAALETGYGKFGGAIDGSFCNPCGLKTEKGGEDDDKNAHKKFTSWEEGVAAHIDHIALYAGAVGYPRKNSPDPRHFSSLLGKGKTISELSMGWCPSNKGYAKSLMEMMVKMGESSVSQKTDDEITADNAFADGVITDRKYWLRVLNGEIAPEPKHIKTVLDRYHTLMH